MKAADLAKYASISYRQLDFWTRAGYLRVTSIGPANPVPSETADAIRADHQAGMSDRAIGFKHQLDYRRVARIVSGDYEAVTTDPERCASPGSGHTRDYDGDEVLIARRMGQLVAGGLVPANAADVARRSVEQGRLVVTIADGISISFDPPEMHPTARDLATMEGQPEMNDLAPVVPCPECRAGKHPNCPGQTWDDATDAPAECPCPCRGSAVGL